MSVRGLLGGTLFVEVPKCKRHVQNNVDGPQIIKAFSSKIGLEFMSAGQCEARSTMGYVTTDQDDDKRAA